MNTHSFIFYAMIYLAMAVISVPLFKRAGLGSILGYLVSGAAIGPFGFGLITHSESILHFSELGIVFLLFIIGLELQPNRLWSLRRHLFGLGGMQMAACSAAFGAAAYFFGLSPVASVIAGLALALSSTAFTLQTLAERNQLNTEFGRSSFAILLFQDLAAIPLLAVLPFLGASASSGGFGMAEASALVLLLAAMLLFSRFGLHKLFRVIASTHNREIFTALTLLLVMSVAFAMSSIGLSMALGAFLTGVLLSQSEYRHELEANLEPFKGLLMGLFFIAVGMTVDLTLLLQKPLLIVAITFAYMTVKSFLIFGAGRIFGLRMEASRDMGLNLAQGGEFAFVIFSMALQYGLFASEEARILNLVVTLSMALSPLLFFIDRRYVQPIYNRKIGEKAFDAIDVEDPPVIIAGFGRVGQIFGRILRTQAIPFVALDHDSEQIEIVRKFGNKVFFGDASRLDLLEAAGAAKAKLFILAIDDPKKSNETAQVVRQHFPHLKILARARNRLHTFELMDLGVPHIRRETFESSISLAHEMLLELGYTKETSARITQNFKQHDEATLLRQFAVRDDEKELINLSKQEALRLAELLSTDK